MSTMQSPEEGLIWIDITNLPHLLFFKDFIRNYSNIFVTARKIGNIDELLRFYGISCKIVGHHGASLEEKLILSANRIIDLVNLIKDRNIKVALSKRSVELARVAFGLGIPVITVIDNEYSEKQNRLVLPLSDIVVKPTFTSKELLIKQGAGNIVEFYGLCEVAHVLNFEPREVNEEYLLIRPEPFRASYFKGKLLCRDLISALKAKFDIKIYVIPRFNERYEGAVVPNTVDSLNLLYNAKIFIGGGGTMCREACLLGTPTISFYSQELLGVDKFLIDQGLLYHSVEHKEILSFVDELLDKKSEFRIMANRLVKKMENPHRVLRDVLENYLK